MLGSATFCGNNMASYMRVLMHPLLQATCQQHLPALVLVGLLRPPEIEHRASRERDVALLGNRQSDPAGRAQRRTRRAPNNERDEWKSRLLFFDDLKCHFCREGGSAESNRRWKISSHVNGQELWPNQSLNNDKYQASWRRYLAQPVA
jgi:hypothetical protein